MELHEIQDDEYGVFFDPILCERLAEGLLLALGGRGPGRRSLADGLATALEALRADFELECPGLCTDWLLRALHAHCGRMVSRLREALEEIFAQLQDHGRCLVDHRGGGTGESRSSYWLSGGNRSN